MADQNKQDMIPIPAIQSSSRGRQQDRRSGSSASARGRRSSLGDGPSIANSSIRRAASLPARSKPGHYRPSVSPGAQVSHTLQQANQAAPFDVLPVELKVDILSYFSATEVVRLREVSRHFKEVIDTNDRALTKIIMGRKIREFDEGIDGFDYSRHDSIVTALAHWLEHKGLWFSEPRPAREATNSTFILAGDFTSHYLAVHNGSSDWEDPLAFHALDLIALHLKFHTAFPHFPDITLEQAIANAGQTVLPDWAKANTGAASDIQRIKYGELGDPITWETWDPEIHADVDTWALSYVTWDFQAGRQTADEAAAFMALFGFKPLQTSYNLRGPGAKVAYCCRKRDLDTVEERVEIATRKEVRLLAKASILDMVFIW